MTKYPLLLSLTLTAAASAFAADGIEVTPLLHNNTLVRVAPEKRFLLLPVQESVADSKIELLVDGKVEKTFYVRLADSNVDFMVPLDLTPYKGNETILLNVVSEADRSHSSREVSDFVCWNEMTLSDNFDTTNREKLRPAYHHTPIYGWMNDPNGMFYNDGKWHLYYQWNPYGSKWQNMTWGHSSSSDLVNWENHGAAIEPDGLGTIFSGSAVVDKANTAGYGENEVIAIYTSANINQVQSLAHSSDSGITFEKESSNPIIVTPREARDPNMFWNEETGKWNLVLAQALDHEMLIFSSDDLKNWTLESSFGKGWGSQDGVWECPDLMKLPVKGTDKEKWVLICNINPGGPFGGSATQYFVGDFDGKTFTADTGADVTKWMDFGKDHYATVSWSNAPDDRHVVIGWMSNWEYANDVPTSQYRSSNTLPRDLSLFVGPDKQIYLASNPSPELKAMRSDSISYTSQTLSDKPATFAIPELCEIVLTLEEGNASDINIALANASGEMVDMTLDNTNRTFSMDRTKSGVTNFSKHFPATTTAPTFSNPKAKKKEQQLRLYVDRCSIEAFGNDGAYAMTNLVFPTEPYSTLSITANGSKAKIKSLEIYTLSPNN